MSMQFSKNPWLVAGVTGIVFWLLPEPAVVAAAIASYMNDVLALLAIVVVYLFSLLLPRLPEWLQRLTIIGFAVAWVIAMWLFLLGYGALVDSYLDSLPAMPPPLW